MNYSQKITNLLMSCKIINIELSTLWKTCLNLFNIDNQ